MFALEKVKDSKKRATVSQKFCNDLLIDLVAGCEHPNFKTLCLIFKTTFYWLIQILASQPKEN